MYTRIGKISVHTLNLSQVLAAAYRADIHLKLLMTTIIAVCKGKVNSLIKSHIHCSSDQSFDCLDIIIDWIFNILNLTTVAKLPETILQILLLNRSNILCYMTVEAVGNILSV